MRVLHRATVGAVRRHYSCSSRVFVVVPILVLLHTANLALLLIEDLWGCYTPVPLQLFPLLRSSTRTGTLMLHLL